MFRVTDYGRQRWRTRPAFCYPSADSGHWLEHKRAVLDVTRKLGERTRTRSSLTLALQRIAARIASEQVYEVEWSDRLFGAQSSRIRVEGLWVAGSYARGALDCGDLDVIAKVVSEQGILPWRATISRTLVGHAPDVRLYSGTPEKNSSGVSFPEARLVWSPAEPNWQAAISAITVDPSAARYSRRTDALPVRTEQLYLDNLDALEQLLDLKLNQVIDWVWLPADEISVRPETWSSDAREFADSLRQQRGKKTHSVMQFVIQYHEQYDNCAIWDRSMFSDKSSFRVGGSQVFAGRPPVQVELLNEIWCSSLVVAPHLSRRGPNGLWIISRGVNHPIEQAFRERTLYYLEMGKRPWIVQEIDGWRRIHSLELFRSAKHADKVATKERTELKKEGQEEFEIDVAAATGSELLRLIAAVDVIEIASARLAISRDGMFFDDVTERASADTLLALIDGARGKSRR